MTVDPAHIVTALPEQASEHWTTVTPEAKRATDAASWGAWLRRYCQRLAREAAAGATPDARAAAMRGVNPRVVLRNWVAEEAIRAAEAGDFSKVWGGPHFWGLQ